MTDFRYVSDDDNLICPFRDMMTITLSDDNGEDLELKEYCYENIKNLTIDKSKIYEPTYDLKLENVISFCKLPVNTYKIVGEVFPWKNDGGVTMTRNNHFTCLVRQKTE